MTLESWDRDDKKISPVRAAHYDTHSDNNIMYLKRRSKIVSPLQGFSNFITIYPGLGPWAMSLVALSALRAVTA